MDVSIDGSLFAVRIIIGGSPLRPVDRHVSQVRQQFGGPFLGLRHRDQIGALLDEPRGELARQKFRIVQHRTQEGHVVGHSPDAELRESAPWRG